MTVLRARAVNAQGAPVQGRQAVLEPWQGDRYRTGYTGPRRSQALFAISGADGWMQWDLPSPLRKPGPKGLAWVITGLETQPVVVRTQPSDGVVDLEEKRVGAVDTGSGELVPDQAPDASLDSLAEVVQLLRSGRLSEEALTAAFSSSGDSGRAIPDTVTTLRAWHVALAARHIALAKVLVVSDSNGEGAGATQIPRRWVDRLAAALYARFPTAGSQAGTNYLPAKFSQNTTPASAVLAGNPAPGVDFGLGARQVQMYQAGMSATFTVVGTAVDVVWLRFPGLGNATVTVDGGTPVTINGAGTATSGMTTRVSLGALGSHTVVVAWSSGAGFFLEGLRVFAGNENSGIHVYDGSHSGWDAFQFQHSTPAQYHWQAAGSLGAHLVIISLGLNVWSSNTSTAEQYRTNLSTVVDRAKALPGGPSVLIAAEHERSPGSAVVPWSAWVQVMREVAAAKGAAFLDLGQRLPSVPSDTRGLYADIAHLSDKGHALQAEVLASVLAPAA
jgi:GDSL-like Lipase/Acylhydrolase family